MEIKDGMVKVNQEMTLKISIEYLAPVELVEMDGAVTEGHKELVDSIKDKLDLHTFTTTDDTKMLYSIESELKISNGVEDIIKESN